MSRRRSPIVGKRYPLRTVCEVWRVPRSTVVGGRGTALVRGHELLRAPR